MRVSRKPPRSRRSRPRITRALRRPTSACGGGAGLCRGAAARVPPKPGGDAEADDQGGERARRRGRVERGQRGVGARRDVADEAGLGRRQLEAGARELVAASARAARASVAASPRAPRNGDVGSGARRPARRRCGWSRGGPRLRCRASRSRDPRAPGSGRSPARRRRVDRWGAAASPGERGRSAWGWCSSATRRSRWRWTNSPTAALASAYSGHWCSSARASLALLTRWSGSGLEQARAQARERGRDRLEGCAGAGRRRRSPCPAGARRRRRLRETWRRRAALADGRPPRRTDRWSASATRRAAAPAACKRALPLTWVPEVSSVDRRATP